MPELSLKEKPATGRCCVQPCKRPGFQHSSFMGGTQLDVPASLMKRPMLLSSRGKPIEPPFDKLRVSSP